MGNTTSYTIPQSLIGYIGDIEKINTKQYPFKSIMKSRVPLDVNKHTNMHIHIR